MRYSSRHEMRYLLINNIMKIKKKTATLNLKVAPDFKARLTALAAAENRSITSLVEWLVLAHERRTQKGRAKSAAGGADADPSLPPAG